jgi:hypothetical protein
VKNIIVLQKMTSLNVMAKRAFLNQTACLNKIKEVIEEEYQKNAQVNAFRSHNLARSHTAEPEQ